MAQVTLVLSRPPYTSGASAEHLDMALAAGNFNTDVTLVFVDDGVFNLMKNQQPEAFIDAKNPAKTYAALPFYDVEHIYACKTSLAQRGISEDNIIEQATVITQQDLKQQFNQAQHVVVF